MVGIGRLTSVGVVHTTTRASAQQERLQVLKPPNAVGQEEVEGSVGFCKYLLVYKDFQRGSRERC